MTDETDTMGEVARVLGLHASFKASAEIQDPNTPWYWECDGCDARLLLSGTYGRPEVIAALADHQADLLAEAGLLRDSDLRLTVTERLGQPTHVRIERNGVLIVDGRIEGPRDALVRPQIATQEPAGQPSAGSAGRGAWGGGSGAPEHAWHRPDDLCATIPCPQVAPGQSLYLSTSDGHPVIRGEIKPTHISFAPELMADIDEQIDAWGKRLGDRVRAEMGLAPNENENEEGA